MAKTIPADVLTKLSSTGHILRRWLQLRRARALARNYLTGESRLTGFETYRFLAAIAAGQDW